MAIRLFNSATRNKEEFVPQSAEVVTMYNCGPTVYDYFHVGNARNFVVMDAIRRHFQYRGYNVKFVQNFTDIDDKIIKRANENGEPWDKLAERFTKAYFHSADSLGVRRADVHPKATEHIPEQIDLVTSLIEKGLAYATSTGDVYFRVRSFKSYGELSGKNIDDLMEGARVEVGDLKEDPLDFALWKSAKPGEPSWDSPWGKGRPGWHLECSAMSMKHLGETIDIHSGGVDLLFPHHENERAQSCGCSGKPFVRYWLHNGFLTIDKQKMSKSLGNFFTIDQVLERYKAAAVRFYLLSAHYRHPLDYSDSALDEAKAGLGRIREAIITAEKLIPAVAGDASPDSEATAKFQQAFDEAMDDDFNTQKAIGIVFEIVSMLNETRQKYAHGDQSVASTGLAYLQALHQMLERLGLDALMFDTSADTGLTDGLVELLIQTRKQAKEAKQYQLADFVRDELSKMGIRLQDHPGGTIWLK